jgi:hypothetical protein
LHGIITMPAPPQATPHRGGPSQPSTLAFPPESRAAHPHPAGREARPQARDGWQRYLALWLALGATVALCMWMALIARIVSSVA